MPPAVTTARVFQVERSLCTSCVHAGSLDNHFRPRILFLADETIAGERKSGKRQVLLDRQLLLKAIPGIAQGRQRATHGPAPST